MRAPGIPDRSLQKAFQTAMVSGPITGIPFMPSHITYMLPTILMTYLTLSGCNIPVVQPAESVTPVATQPEEKYIPVHRYGRYTLVELAPESAQLNLLLQVVDLKLPSTMTITVGDALQYVLLRSGYGLCDSASQGTELFNLPLPAAHLSLGPLLLRDALQTLAGPAWSLKTNARLRKVCFDPVDDFTPAKTSAISARSEVNS
jgi:type IV pili sensor histidine kinase/response regulator